MRAIVVGVAPSVEAADPSYPQHAENAGLAGVIREVTLDEAWTGSALGRCLSMVSLTGALLAEGGTA